MQGALQPLEIVNATIDEGKMTPMDPRLQRIIAFRRSGLRKEATSSTSEDEIAVLAKVSNVNEWMNMTEVRSAVAIGKSDDDGQTIVTGRIPIKRIEHIRSLPFVKSLKASRRLHPALSATITEIEAPSSAAAVNASPVGGKGTVVGIIDFGCDFRHANFINANNTTRIKKLWDQTGNGNDAAVDYGEVFDEGRINTALTMAEPYSALGYMPEKASHGTHVMDIAAGNGIGTGVPGVAPEADIIFVHLDGSDVPWEGESIGKNFGDSVQLLEAMSFIFKQAGAKPCVINASLGTNGGPHDGTTLVEQGIDSLVKQKPNRAVVIAAANSFGDNIHAGGTVQGGGTHDLQWIVSSDDDTENEMEIWYPGAGKLDVEIIDPSGKSLGLIPPNESGTVKDAAGDLRLFAANRLDEPNNHDNMIGIYLARSNAGKWIVRLTNKGMQPVPFHAWIERDDDGQSFFAAPNDNTHTLGSLSCGKLSIAVGSYDAHRKALPLSWFSSAGPTRDGRQKPEVSAPGNAVVAAQSRTKKGVTTMSGTSMAAPAVAGAIAVLFAEAKKRNLKLTIDQVRTIVSKSIRKTPPTKAWDDRYGAGRISVKKMIAALPGSPPPKKAAPKKTSTKKAAPQKAAAKKAAAKKSATKKRAAYR